MKIVSWNVNGLRTLDTREHSLRQVFDELDAEIIAVQETRISRKDPRLGSLAILPGYDAFFSFCHVRDGYSGVATYCRRRTNVCATPVDAGQGFTSSVGGGKASFLESDGLTPDLLARMESEGRCVVTDHGRFVLLNVYVPAVTVESRASFKYKFCLALQRKVEALQRAGRHVVVAGDLNISHRKIDRAENLSVGVDLGSSTRAWLNRFLTTGGMVDTFRHFNRTQKNAFTCWSTQTNAREVNYGVRIDYVLASRELVSQDSISSTIFSSVYGSDHCPVSTTFKDEHFSSKEKRDAPRFCVKFIPELAARQTNIFEYFGRVTEGQREKSGETLVSAHSSSSTLNQQGAEERHTTTERRRRLQLPISAFFFAKREENTRRDVTVSELNQSDGPQLKLSGCEKSMAAKEDMVKRSLQWKSILQGPPDPPVCRKHQKPCLVKVVTKKSKNRGRKFFTCSRPDCNTFFWYSEILARRKRLDVGKSSLT